VNGSMLFDPFASTVELNTFQKKFNDVQ